MNKNIHNIIEFFKVDFVLFILLLILAIFGLVVLYSASSESSNLIGKQILHFIIAFGAMFIVAQFTPKFMQRIALYVLGFGVFSLIMIFVFGVSRGGSTRWLDFGFFMYQPSELIKLVLPIAIAKILSDKYLPPKILHSIISIIIILFTATLILLQPDLGTAIIIASSGFFVLFFAGFSIKIFKNSYYNYGFILLSIASIITIAWKFILKEYQQQRVLTMFNPESDPLGAGYHIIQSKIAIGSGGMFGKGYGAGTQSQLDFLPEHATDFIFATISEELGFVGALLLMFIYILILYRCFYLANSIKDIFSKLVISSIAMVFFIYIFINIAMVTGLLPVVGVPLPFISYGGSSILTLMLGFGIIMAINKHQAPKYLY